MNKPKRFLRRENKLIVELADFQPFKRFLPVDFPDSIQIEGTIDVVVGDRAINEVVFGAKIQPIPIVAYEIQPSVIWAIKSKHITERECHIFSNLVHIQDRDALFSSRNHFAGKISCLIWICSRVETHAKVKRSIRDDQPWIADFNITTVVNKH